MMLVKLIGIALIGVVCVAVLRSARSEFAVFAVIATGVVMLVTLTSALGEVVLAFEKFSGCRRGATPATFCRRARRPPPSAAGRHRWPGASRRRLSGASAGG